MTNSTHSSILRRKAGQNDQTGADSPLTSSRAVRLALAKSASDSVGLSLTVSSVIEDIVSIDDLLDQLDEGLMLVGLQCEGRVVGLLALDIQMRSAVVEIQTMGRLVARQAADRPPTATDKAMCEPVLSALLDALPAAVTGTNFDGWVDGLSLGGMIESTRAAGLTLDDGSYRALRMTVDLGVADRETYLLLALPVVTAEEDVLPEPQQPVDWATALRGTVSAAPATLDAVLHRFKIPIGRAQSLRVGQLVPLPGCTVNSVRLTAPGGRAVASAKLGQAGGMRALRIEDDAEPQLSDLGGRANATTVALGVRIDQDALNAKAAGNLPAAKSDVQPAELTTE